MMIETENTEFKLQITDEIYKEVIAFANTDGGTIYIGIDDNGNAVGIDNIDENGPISDWEVQRLLSIGKTRAYTLMKEMEREGLIIISGRGVNKRYLNKTK